MLENLLEKYDNRYRISKYSKFYSGNLSGVGFKKTATTFLTAAFNPKPFIDGAIFGSVFGLSCAVFEDSGYIINTFGGGVGFGLINQQQYYFVMGMDHIFDIFNKDK